VRTLDSASTPLAAPVAGALVDQFAAAVAELGHDSVRVLGGQTPLTDALTAKGLTVVPSGEAVFAIVSAGQGGADLAAEDLDSTTGEILLWRADGAPLGDWIAMLATHGYFRSDEQPITVPGVTCVRLAAGTPTPAELVRRYEALIATQPDRSAELRQLRHDLLTSRDHAIGAEAAIARLRIKEQATQAHVAELRDSTTWRVGTMVVSWPARMKRMLHR
jgi:hypothetical protein